MYYIIYMVNCNSTIHAICLLAFMVYIYNELEVSSAIKKLSCKATCKTPFFLIMFIKTKYDIYANFTKKITNN
jgi:hypothetical protein